MKLKNLFLVVIIGSFIPLYSKNNDENNNKKGRAMVELGLAKKNRKTISEQLNKLLANEYVLYTKTLKYHWNVKGKYFGPLHALFKEQYEQLFNFIDDVAERSLALGFEADGSLAAFVKNTTLEEKPGKNPDADDMIENLLKDHEAIIKQLRDDINLTAELGDWGTNNFLSDLIMKHEKIAWMLRAHLQ